MSILWAAFYPRIILMCPVEKLRIKSCNCLLDTSILVRKMDIVKAK